MKIPTKSPVRCSRQATLVKHSFFTLAALASLLLGQNARANTQDTVTGSAAATALDSAGSYSGGLPGTTSDVVFASGTAYAGSFTLNAAALGVGTLNDLSSIALTITGNKVLTFNGGSNSVTGANVSDLIYVAGGGNLTINDSAAGALSFLSSGNIDNAGTLSLGTSAFTIGAAQKLTFTGSGTTTVGGAAAASTGAVSVAGGTVIFSGANLYTGGLTLT
ncbi:MAG: hypothetical protein WCD79_16560, partial [Chthoniobacteraceae bacterium]